MRSTLGSGLPTLHVEPTSISLFRFSAVTWNAHRIHYEAVYAASEGYPDVVVHSHLHGSWLLIAVRSWLGNRGRVEKFSWRNRHYAVRGDRLTINGEIAEVEGDRRRIELREVNQDGVTCASGQAVVRLGAEIADD